MQREPKDGYDEAMLVGMMLSDIQSGVLVFSHVTMRRLHGTVGDAEKTSLGLMADVFVLKIATFDFGRYRKPDLYYEIAAGFEYKDAVGRYFEARRALGITSFSEEMERMVQAAFAKMGFS